MVSMFVGNVYVQLGELSKRHCEKSGMEKRGLEFRTRASRLSQAQIVLKMFLKSPLNIENKKL